MEINTHLAIDQELCGIPVRIGKQSSFVEMEAVDRMVVDGSGLVHGGFVFGLADHAAMIAVNHPNVVLGASDVRFLKPVVVGDRLVANAVAEEGKGKKRQVEVVVSRGEDQVFQGTFTCFVLERHILERA